MAFGAIGAGQVAAATFQVNLQAEVEQRILTFPDNNGHPGFYHTNQGLGDPYTEGYIYFDEHTRILREESGIWDSSLIPSNPSQTPFANSHELTSRGNLSATWTFDASLISNINLSIPANNGDDGLTGGQFLGTTSNVSSFRVVSNGAVVGTAVSTASRVVAANNVQLTVDGGPSDVLLINASLPNEPYRETDGIFLALAGSETWFDDFVQSGSTDYESFFSDVQLAQASVDERNFYAADVQLPTGVVFYAGDAMFDSVVETTLAPQSLTFSNFGAADGSSEQEPLLPGSAEIGAEGTGPTFSFEVTTADPGDLVFIDPEIAVGYTYTLTGDGEFAAFQAPSASSVEVPDDFQGYTVTVKGGPSDGATYILLPGERIDFEDGEGVVALELTGIPIGLEIEPEDYSTFVAGVALYFDDTAPTVNQTAIVINTDTLTPVPVPGAGLLLLTALGAFAFVRRRAA